MTLHFSYRFVRYIANQISTNYTLLIKINASIILYLSHLLINRNFFLLHFSINFLIYFTKNKGQILLKNNFMFLTEILVETLILV